MQCAWLPSGQRISIHALREEGDQAALDMGKATTNFYPRPPRGGRPAVVCESMLLSYFYPRPPRGGRPKTISILHGRTIFLSTPSARRATLS